MAILGLAQAGVFGQSAGDYALIAGSVFRDPGFALVGAEVILTPKAAPGSKKRKPQKTASDSRGEFAFRVPPGPAEYVILVKAAGFEPVEKSLRVEANERLDQYFTLKAAAKKE